LVVTPYSNILLPEYRNILSVLVKGQDRAVITTAYRGLKFHLELSSAAHNAATLASHADAINYAERRAVLHRRFQ